jgi:leucyl/phenylalanyl-tRNA--protein transferase
LNAYPYSENINARVRRWVLGTLYALRAKRVCEMQALLAFTTSRVLLRNYTLPRSSEAMTVPDGLCGIGNDWSVPVLLEGYARGMFPFCHYGPLKWWAPSERMVLHFPELHIAKRLRRQIRNGGYTVTFDTAFDDVIQACAQPRRGKVALTWITPRIMQIYRAAFDAGDAHSFEVWNAEGKLVGGGYGLAFGRIFSTESQFSREANTSKIGFMALNWHLAHWGFLLNDGKRYTPTIDGMGFRPIAREAYTTVCSQHGYAHGRTGRWAMETDLATVATWRPEEIAALGAAA